MNAAPAEYKVKYYRSTHPGVMTLSFLLIAYVISRIAANYTIPHDEKWMVDCAIGLFVLGSGFFAIKWTPSVSQPRRSSSVGWEWSIGGSPGGISSRLELQRNTKQTSIHSS